MGSTGGAAPSRIFVIEPPDRELIPAIIVRYTPAAVCSPGEAREIGEVVAETALGLSCAHIREHGQSLDGVTVVNPFVHPGESILPCGEWLPSPARPLRRPMSTLHA